MNQVRIGKFIARKRKEKELTQREFADLLGVSDKAVSKWETGNGMPDVSLMLPLCEVLDINLNELFSGEELSSEEYLIKAEENILKLLKNQKNTKKNIVGGRVLGEAINVKESTKTVHETNTRFWNTIGSDVLGVTSLPSFGGFVSEEKLCTLGDMAGKKILEIGCGSGHSLKYVNDKGAEELWGIDISKDQIKRASYYLSNQRIDANLICTSMEDMEGIPESYFDIIYSVFGIGWSTDLKSSFRKIYACLKPGGIFVFNWSHPIHKCVTAERGVLMFSNSYFDESWYKAQIDEGQIMLSNRKLSTYINELIEAGFTVERLVEENDEELLQGREDEFSRKARMLPVVFVIRARKNKC